MHRRLYGVRTSVWGEGHGRGPSPLKPPTPGPDANQGLRFLCLYCKNSPEWMLAAEACYRTGVVVVPMYDTLGVPRPSPTPTPNPDPNH